MLRQIIQIHGALRRIHHQSERYLLRNILINRAWELRAAQDKSGLVLAVKRMWRPLLIVMFLLRIPTSPSVHMENEGVPFNYAGSKLIFKESAVVFGVGLTSETVPACHTCVWIGRRWWRRTEKIECLLNN